MPDDSSGRTALAAAMEAPPVFPPGWTRREVQAPSGWRVGSLLWRADLPDGCQATYAVETYPPGAGDPPLGLPGRYRRLVTSRRADDRSPSWEVMRDFIRTCGLFDRRRDVFMLLPPEEQYVTLSQTAFHWWQRDEAPA